MTIGRAAAATIPVTATWTGAAGTAALHDAANWDCRNSSGIRLNDALPCDRTRVYVCSDSAAMNAPVGTVVPWSYFSIEAANATLAGDVATLRFTSAEGEHFGLQKKDDGLYITRGIIILVR